MALKGNSYIPSISPTQREDELEIVIKGRGGGSAHFSKSWKVERVEMPGGLTARSKAGMNSCTPSTSEGVRRCIQSIVSTRQPRMR